MLNRSSGNLRFTFMMFCRTLLVLVLLFAYSSASTSPKPQELKHRKVCRGSVSAVSHSHGSDVKERHRMYRKQYGNCTYVMGNLVIQFLEVEDDYDMGFLKDIEEVSGFVLILGNYFSHLNLTSLRVIRGKTLFKPGNVSAQAYSLYVSLNYKKGSQTVGLRELGLVSLQDIMAGSVYLSNNNMLCYEDSINWKDILADEAEVSFGNDDPSRRTCNQCHENCTHNGDRHCWGEGPDMCQTLTKVICSKQCESRCFGPGPNECCRPACAGGCSGPFKTDCFACRNFIDEGVCVERCPPLFIYKDNEFKWVPNPNAKYAYGNLCVNECPDHLIADMGACVSDCSPGFKVENRKCVPCNVICPKSCPGTGSDHLTTQNIQNFTGCTIINGNLRILQSTFNGDPPRNLSGISVDQLSVFENVKEITNFLVIQGQHDQFVNLSFLSNLVTIYGRNLDGSYPPGSSLAVTGTSLMFLGLNSLTEILNGGVFVGRNRNLCYVNSVNWSSVTASRVKLFDNGNDTICEEEGNVCSPLCSNEGCWGPGDDQCLSCNGYRYGKRCTDSCEALEGWFKFETNGTRECRKCNEECQGSCTGEGADQCSLCKHAKDGPFCVALCPPFKYADARGICKSCHENCEGGCTGPDNTVGPGACNACSVVVYDGEPLQPVKCLRPESDCETGFYIDYIRSANSEKETHKHKACYRCHPECTVCFGGDISFCSLSSCVNYVEGKRCVSYCSSDHYGDAEKRKCFQCDKQCLRCSGPTSSDCISCRDLKLYKDIEHRDVDPSFNCTDKCPDYAPVKISDTFNGERESICVSEAYEQAILGEPKKKQTALIVGIIVGLVVIGIVVITIICVRRQITRSKENQLRLTAKLTGLDEECEVRYEPLDPSNAKPDMSKLHLIQERELERENIIGSGAFGTVYKAAWKPSGENVKIPVAVKVLHESSPGQNKELLEEARIMASVEHQCCVRILAVCMTAQMMLVTQLMPLGCLLDYIRSNQKNIGSKVLLNWSTQIAKGMKYLESRGIVHRDLAARNVLVQSPNHVKITDFGLAKLLDFNQEQFQATGGKMPIKWLALECIQHRIFTHKTDVWSFGVTMWELFTYGQRPYENIVARDIPNLLEKGERLPQPPICTIDVYMIMIKCWMLDAESRPSFQELADEFAKMARDPGRFLVIQPSQFTDDQIVTQIWDLLWQKEAEVANDKTREISQNTNQGDKLMKLPEHKIDTRDLLTEVTGPEQIISADEYLQPQQLNHDHSVLKKGRNSDRNRPSALSTNHSSPKSDARSNGLESTGNRNKRRDHTNSRYSSDPCKLLHAGSSDDGREGSSSPSHNAEDGEDGTGQQLSPLDVPVKLPIDEDDYLQPSLSSPSTYIEVLDSDTDSPRSGSLQSPAIVSNPEYFEENVNPSQGPNRRQEMQPLKFRNPSTGSEPEYYNEQDGLYNRKGQTDPRPYNESEV